MFDQGSGDAFAGTCNGGSVVLVGAAPSLAAVDLHAFDGIPTIAANRILLHEWFVPDYLVLCDRTPYIAERESGRLSKTALRTKILASETIWDRKIASRGAPVQEKPDFRYWKWRVGTCSTPSNYETMKRPLCSFGTIIGPMIQMAAIMGAWKIGVVGVDLVAPPQGSYHFYHNECPNEGANAVNVFRSQTGIASPATIRKLREARDELDTLGISLFNLSPTRKCPFADIFGNATIEDFLCAN